MVYRYLDVVDLIMDLLLEQIIVIVKDKIGVVATDVANIIIAKNQVEVVHVLV
tara:strand:- start:433 stop:591 length:159 start_codon:yes stop_codon:yes gene_type:complete